MNTSFYSSYFNNMHFYNYCTTEIDSELCWMHVFIQQYILRHLVQTDCEFKGKIKTKQNKNLPVETESQCFTDKRKGKGVLIRKEVYYYIENSHNS